MVQASTESWVVTMAGGFAGLKSVGFAPSTVMKNFELGLSSEHFSWLFGVREGGELMARSSAGLLFENDSQLQVEHICVLFGHADSTRRSKKRRIGKGIFLRERGSPDFRCVVT